MVLIDSSAWIHCFRPEGDETVRARVQTALETGVAVWCDMVKLELWNGARGAQEKNVLRQMEQAIPLLVCGQKVWETAFDVARSIRAKGQTVPSTDILIFSCARSHGASLIHNDKHLTWLENYLR